MWSSKLSVPSVLILALAAPAAGAAPAPGAATTKQTMQRVFDSLSVLLPASISAAAWQEAAKGEPVRAALAQLESAAGDLQAHGGPEGQSFQYFSRSLGDDARAIRQRVEQGRYEAASYLTQRMTETCVACHTRLPAQPVADFPAALLRRVDQTAISPLARARLQTATRQFDAGLATYEAEFANRAASPLLLEAVVPSYLIVALRVRRDPARAERGLAALAERPDLSAQLEQNLHLWRSALHQQGSALAEPPSVERAAKLLSDGRALCEFPSDGADLAHAVLASSVVYRYLEESRPQGMDLARALYLLGQTEAYTRTSFEQSDAQHYLEQVIELAPHTPLAARAYSQLERERVLGYTGSAGVNVPADVQQELQRLRDRSRAFEEPDESSGKPADGSKAPPSPRRKPHG